MALLITNPYGSTLSAAFKLARERGIYPTWMGTAEIRDLKKEIKERAVFSARTTNAVYLDELKQRIERFVANGYDGDQAKLRLELKDILLRLQYDPVTGFPGDDELGIPPARAGSLQDLISDKRINLILDTQLKLLAGKGQEQQGLSEAALDLFPAYELVRLESRRVPREWLKDWETAAENVNWEGVSKKAFKQGRMIALKISPIWAAVGSSALFADALDVSFPPFRFNSGMGWEVKDREEAEAFGLSLQRFSQDAELQTRRPNTIALAFATALSKQKADPELAKTMAKLARDMTLPLPPATVSTNGLSAATLERLKSTLKNAEAKTGKLTLKSVFGSAPPPPRKQRMNAEHLCDGLDALMELIS
jgi:hypothetical protein